MKRHLLTSISLLLFLSSLVFASSRIVNLSPAGLSVITINDVQFVNENVGYAAASGGLFLKTINRGLTWESRMVATTGDTWNAVKFISETEGYLAGTTSAKGIIYRTIDGGNTWNEFIVSNNIIAFNCLDAGMAGGTLNSGSGSPANVSYGASLPWTETLLGSDLGQNLYGVSVNGSIAYTCGNYVKSSVPGMYKYSFGFWNTLTTVGNTALQHLKSVQVLTVSQIWTVGDDSAIFRTTDGGAVWTAQSSGIASSNPFVDIHFFNNDNGWVISGLGDIYRTTNGSAAAVTWTAETNPVGVSSLKAAYSQDVNNAWFVGALPSGNPLILKYLTDPTITAITRSGATPTQASQGFSGNLTFTGTNFQTGSTVTADAGVTINSVTITSSTTATVNITISPTAAAGTKTFYWLNLDTGIATGTFTVSARPIANITLNGRNDRPLGYSGPFEITGSGFQTGINVDSQVVTTQLAITSNTATTITGIITIAATSLTGVQTLDVTNPDSGATTCAFTVNPLPTISSVTSATMQQGATGSVVIAGSGFLSSLTGSALVFSGSGITVNSLTWESAYQLRANFSIAASAATGSRNLTINNPDGASVTGAGVFSVSSNDPGVIVTAPTVTSLSPDSAIRGQTLNLTFNGSNFQTGATVSLGSGITINSVTFVNATSLTINATVSSDASTGMHTATVINTNGGVGSLNNAFLVLSAATVVNPTVTSILPSTILATPSGPVVSTVVSYPPYILTGAGFQTGEVVTITSSTTTDTVLVTLVTHISSTQLSLTLIPPTAAGVYNINVLNLDGGYSTGAGLLTVQATSTTLQLQPRIVSGESVVGIPYPNPWRPGLPLNIQIFANSTADITLTAFQLDGTVIFRDMVNVLGGRPATITIPESSFSTLGSGMMIFVLSSGGQTLGKIRVMRAF
ncbi:hypothetical protein HZB07_03075 [Candidatus Saganbacteria bacterium]|nr:hypothetical protein [Candidatus Saganbacteria bacterium]